MFDISHMVKRTRSVMLLAGGPLNPKRSIDTEEDGTTTTPHKRNISSEKYRSLKTIKYKAQLCNVYVVILSNSLQECLISGEF